MTPIWDASTRNSSLKTEMSSATAENPSRSDAHYESSVNESLITFYHPINLYVQNSN